MMSRRSAAALVAGAILCVAGLRAATRGASPQPRPAHAGPPVPIVVELFTSEGCSSCPPADTLLAKLAESHAVEGAEVIALGHHVDYWDELGWKDRFSSAALTERQRVYSRALNVDSIYTPQLVVDGRAELVGSDGAAARRAIERAVDVPHGRLTLIVEPAGAGAVSVAVSASGLPTPGRGDRDDIVVAVTEDHLQTDVRRGENHGRVLSHAAVVRSLATAGQASADAVNAQPTVSRVPIAADWNRGNLNIIAFVQEARSRHIVAAASRPVPSATR
jgi:hypothetical protein